jgi:GrpB-like predicted nucleotidyltransferase (UPF0157 family)
MSYCDKCNQALIGGDRELIEHVASHHVPGPAAKPDDSVPATPPGQRGKIWKLGLSPAAQAELDAKEREAEAKADAEVEAAFQASEALGKQGN